MYVPSTISTRDSVSIEVFAVFQVILNDERALNFELELK
jgi:hypothetical protein